MSKKTFNDKVDELFDDLDLPDEQSIKDATKREKLSKHHTGRLKDETTRKNMLDAAKKKAQDPEWLKANRAAQAKLKKDKKKKEEISKKISEKSKGRKHSEEAKKQMSESRKGKVSWNKGISPTDATKQKLSDVNKGKKLADDTILKIKNNAAKNKAIHTPEGIFLSRTQAAEHYYNSGVKKLASVNSVSVWLFTQTKKDPGNFFYIK